MAIPNAVEDRYLGDGVYASFDGYHIVLDLRGQGPAEQIALGPEVVRSLVKATSTLLTCA